jgi:hypothetical protein
MASCYVGTPVEVQTSLVTLRFAKPEIVLQSLGYSLDTCAGIVRQRRPREVRSFRSPACRLMLKVAKHIAETIDNQQQFHQQGEMVIEVFPLNYAWAYDIVLGGDSIKHLRLQRRARHCRQGSCDAPQRACLAEWPKWWRTGWRDLCYQRKAQADGRRSRPAAGRWRCPFGFLHRSGDSAVSSSPTSSQGEQARPKLPGGRLL